jgi:hypothetical protein
MKRKIAALFAGMAIGAGAPAGYAVIGRAPGNPVVVTKTGLGTVVDIRSIDFRMFLHADERGQDRRSGKRGAASGLWRSARPRRGSNSRCVRGGR